MGEQLIRVVIADDHPLVRDGLRGMLMSRGGFDVVGESADGTEVLALVRSSPPDVVVMDLHMPSLGGVEATRLIKTAAPGVAVLVLTMFDDDDSVFAAIRAGARGYVLKGAGQTEIVSAIEAVARGEAVFGPAVADRVLTLFAGITTTSPEPFPQLTEREREVLEVLAGGNPNAEIARRLGTTQKTIRNHLSNIFTKLQVVDRTQAVIRARDAGYGSDR